MNLLMIQDDVRHSQLIEGIPFDLNTRLTQAHIAMTLFIYGTSVDGQFPNVRQLHSGLMRPTELSLSEIGAWRTWDVYAGPGAHKREKRAQKPSSSHVQMLMKNWYDRCEIFLTTDLTVDEEDAANVCDLLYYHFECIHPFTDGNGRTGRLMRNALRIMKGLPWHTITADAHVVHVEKLRAYEIEEFKPTHADLY